MNGGDDFSFEEEAKPEQQETRATATQYLAIMVSGLELGVPLSRVSEVVQYEGVCPMPGSPRQVRGLVHVRDRLVPVIDLALKLGRPPDPVRSRTCILMLDLFLEGVPFALGVVMDGIATLLDVDPAEIKKAPRMSNEAVPYLQGVVRTARGMLPLIDVEALFAADELSQVAQFVDEEVQDQVTLS